MRVIVMKYLKRKKKDVLVFPGVVFVLSVTFIRGGLVDEWAFCEGCFVYSCYLLLVFPGTITPCYQSRCFLKTLKIAKK